MPKRIEVEIYEPMSNAATERSESNMNKESTSVFRDASSFTLNDY